MTVIPNCQDDLTSPTGDSEEIIKILSCLLIIRGLFLQEEPSGTFFSCFFGLSLKGCEHS